MYGDCNMNIEITPEIKEAKQRFGIIGNSPALMAAFLVTGRVAPTVFAMDKGAALCLERPEDDRPTSRWRCRWHVVPELFPPVS
jgi:hypothetical protein